jgi:SAM-dependent methyltransferase
MVATHIQQQQHQEHYQIEKELASRLRASSREERRELYVSLYNEFNLRVPIYTNDEHLALDADVMRTPQWRFLRRFLRNDTKFLEIGAGTCAIALAAARVVRNVYALEVSAEVTKHIEQPANFELIIFDGIGMPVPTESITVAYSDQVVEHIHPEDIDDHLRNVYRVLEPGGIYICITPNRLNGPHDISKYFDDVATGFHLKEYTNTELSNLLQHAGFAQVRAYVGIPAFYIRVPLTFVRLQESVLERLPRRLNKAVARLSLPWCVRLVGIKVDTRNSRQVRSN